MCYDYADVDVNVVVAVMVIVQIGEQEAMVKRICGVLLVDVVVAAEMGAMGIC